MGEEKGLIKDSVDGQDDLKLHIFQRYPEKKKTFLVFFSNP